MEIIMRFNSITIAPVRSLEVGDLIAREFLGGLITGVITGIVTYPSQLTDEQRQYMIENGLTIPEKGLESIAGASDCLIFGNFRGEGLNKDMPNHMYMDYDVNVAVFPYHPKQPDYVRETAHNKPISENPFTALLYKEVAIGDCDHGCKIYEHSITGERVLAHNSTYGCRL